MCVEEAKKIFEGNIVAVSPEILQEAAKIILSELGKAEEKIAEFEKKAVKDLPGEIWRDVVGYEGLYQVSNFLRVKSLRWQGGRIMKTRNSNYGYPCLNLFKDGESKFFATHILAAKAFIPNPANKPLVHHINANPLTCTVDELMWATYSENENFAYQANRKPRLEGEKNPAAKLTTENVIEILNSYIPGDSKFSGRALAKKFGVSPATISNIICNKNFKNSIPRVSKKTDIKAEKNPMAKLTNEQVKFIRGNYKPRDKNFGAKALAQKFGVCYQEIFLVISNKIFKDID